MSGHERFSRRALADLVLMYSLDYTLFGMNLQEAGGDHFPSFHTKIGVIFVHDFHFFLFIGQFLFKMYKFTGSARKCTLLHIRFPFANGMPKYLHHYCIKNLFSCYFLYPTAPSPPRPAP